MPWQRLVVDVALELKADGLPAYRQVLATLPRQQGKTTLLLSVEVLRALLWLPDESGAGIRQKVRYSAQSGLDARKKLLEDQAPLIEASMFSDYVRHVHRTMGDEYIDFHNGSRIAVTASSLSAGHGGIVDLGMLDEAFDDIDDRREQSLIPAQATRADAQVWIASTAGNEDSIYLERKVAAGRQAAEEDVREGLAYFEWAASPELPVDDPATWRTCMPALGHTITEEVVRLASPSSPTGMTEPDFRRAFLNQWAKGQRRLIPAAVWAGVVSQNAEPAGNMVLGIDVAADRTHSAIVVCDWERRAEVVEYGEGTSWLKDRVVELAKKLDAPIVLDRRGPAGSVYEELLNEWDIQLHAMDTNEVIGACSVFWDRMADRDFRVRGPNGPLDEAVRHAAKRPVGDNWVWARKGAAADLSPLVALTLALRVAIDQSGRGEMWAVV